MAKVILDMVEPADGELVVDVGCGRGVDVMEMARRGMKAVGLDPSSRMVAGAKEHLDAHRESLPSGNSSGAALVRGLGEALPFRERSLDKLICKGSLDHFADMQRTMSDMSRSLKPGGAAIIAVANFDSLSCRLGRWWFPIIKRLRHANGERHPWQPPDDHNYEFNSPFLKETVKDHFEIKKIRGLSLLWTAPYWGKILSLLPGWASSAVLRLCDWGARLFPSLSDVLIIKLTPKGG
jgi:SAM-dependent methyltransferase